MSYIPACGDYAECPICGKVYCEKYDVHCSERLCGNCTRNRKNDQGSDKILFKIKRPGVE